MTDQDPDKKRSLLLVEDSAEDYEAIMRILKKFNIPVAVSWCKSGLEAIEFLDSSRSQRPSLIMLDLNMPGMDGRETLLRIKENQDIRHIPVIVFTTSGNEADIQKCYEAGANCFVQKPFSYDRLVEVVRSIMQHWFDMALLPR